MRDNTSSIQSLTSDILTAVDEQEQLEKTASEQPREFHNDLSKNMFSLAQDLRKIAEDRGNKEVSYEDLVEFRKRAQV